jgi:hypothetical protein
MRGENGTQTTPRTGRLTRTTTPHVVKRTGWNESLNVGAKSGWHRMDGILCGNDSKPSSTISRSCLTVRPGGGRQSELLRLSSAGNALRQSVHFRVVETLGCLAELYASSRRSLTYGTRLFLPLWGAKTNSGKPNLPRNR